VSQIIYFSNVSGNTHRFVQKLGVTATRIGIRTADDLVVADEPYILITPTYGEGVDGKAVPKQVLKFLAHEPNRRLLRGVVAAGNTNFGADYCLAGRKIAAKCQVPLLHRFEILGTTDDVNVVLNRMEETL
jgi:protein involved in ribonucleotide reduction